MFVRLKENNDKGIISLSLYVEPDGEAQLYLHLNGSNSYERLSLELATKLKTVGVDQPTYLRVETEKCVLRYDGLSKVRSAIDHLLDLLEPADYDRLRDYWNNPNEVVLPAARQLQLRRVQSVQSSPVSAAIPLLSEANAAAVPLLAASAAVPLLAASAATGHQIEMIEAINARNEELACVLLGALSAAHDSEMNNAYYNLYDVLRSEEFCAEFDMNVATYQLDVLQSFSEQTIANRNQGQSQFIKHFKQCIRDAKESRIAAKLAIEPFKTADNYLFDTSRDIDSFEGYAEWLAKQYDDHNRKPETSVRIPDDLLNDDANIERVKSLLQTRITQATSLYTSRKAQRPSKSVQFDATRSKFVQLEREYDKRVELLLGENSSNVLSALYQYSSPAERASLKYVLVRTKVPVDTADEEGNTLLHHAVNCRLFGLADLLIARDADIRVINRNGMNPLTFAGMTNHGIRCIQGGMSFNELVRSGFIGKIKSFLLSYNPKLEDQKKWVTWQARNYNDYGVLSYVAALIASQYVSDSVFHNRVKYYNKYLDLFTKAVRFGDARPLAEAIIEHSKADCVTGPYKRSSSFHARLLALAEEFMKSNEHLFTNAPVTRSLVKSTAELQIDEAFLKRLEETRLVAQNMTDRCTVLEKTIHVKDQQIENKERQIEIYETQIVQVKTELAAQRAAAETMKAKQAETDAKQAAQDAKQAAQDAKQAAQETELAAQRAAAEAMKAKQAETDADLAMIKDLLLKRNTAPAAALPSASAPTADTFSNAAAEPTASATTVSVSPEHREYDARLFGSSTATSAASSLPSAKPPQPKGLH